MYLIVGLGNPEEEYSKTRHNMGFNTINKISQQYNIEVKTKQISSIIWKWNDRKRKSNIIKTTNIYELKWK